jgi:hypothetical protein
MVRNKRIIASALVIVISASPLAAQSATGRAWCSTTQGDSVVYMTPIFDSKLKAMSPYRTKVMGYEFAQYIKGRFDHRHSDPFSGTCSTYSNDAQAERVRQMTQAQLIQARIRIVPVEWTYQPDPAEVVFADTAQRADPGEPIYKTGTEKKGFCVTEPFSQPLYVSAVFDFPQPANLAAAQIAWNKFLETKYGYKGAPELRTVINPVYCSDGGRGDPARMMAARVAGAKAAGRKVVETDWKFGSP